MVRLSGNVKQPYTNVNIASVCQCMSGCFMQFPRRIENDGTKVIKLDQHFIGKEK